MDPMSIFLLSMQAAGLVFNMNDAKNKHQMIQTGRDLEKAAIDTNLEALNYDYQQSSLAAMKQLRENIGTQIVTQAARGTDSGSGSALILNQKSISNYNADEQTRRMNLLAKEANLRASNVLSGLHTLQSETELGRATAKEFDSIPVSSAFNEFRRSKLGKEWGFGFKPAGE